MKKMIVMVMVLMVILTACGKHEVAEFETTVPPTTEAVVETTEETTAPIVEATQEPETHPAETDETTEPAVEVPTEPQGVPGIVTARSLNVREEPSVNAKRVAQLPKGSSVTIYEEQFVAGITWGRISEGWVSMDYILKGEGTPEQQQIQKPVTPNESNQLPADPAPVAPDPVKPKPNTPKPDGSLPTAPSSNESNATEPKPNESKPNESKPEYPDPTESKPVEPAQCQHQWNGIQNIPAEYEEHYYVVCSCGARFSDSAAWRSHCDSFSGENLLNHTGYSSGSDRIKISPAKVLDQCALCGATRERVIE